MSDELLAGIAAALGEDRLVAPSERGEASDEDVCRAPIGTPGAWVRPRSTQEVAALVRLARARALPIVACGRRTAYWRPLRFEGAIVLDTGGLAELAPFDRSNRILWAGAGASVREIDDALRREGFVLAAHPDAYGGTSIGSMVATGFSSGVGMGTATIDALVTGLELVLGSGEVVRTGAAASLGAPAFLRTGLPDPTGLWFAAEGALGIVTRVAVRAQPRIHRSRLSFRVAAPLRAMLPLAEALRAPGLYETFRVVDPGEPGRAAALEVDLIVRAPLGAGELDGRVAWVRERVARWVPGATAIERTDEAPEQDARLPRFWGESGEAWTRTRRGRFAPVDVNLGYADVAAAIARAEALLEAHRELAWINLRRALYFAPEFVNFGLHPSLDPARSDDATALAFVRAGAAALAADPLPLRADLGPGVGRADRSGLPRADPRAASGLRSRRGPQPWRLAVWGRAVSDDDERSPLLAALERPALWGPAPALVRRFDACAALEREPAWGRAPEFGESSPQVDADRLWPWRLTHYFDVAGRPLARRLEVAARLRACAAALELAVPPALVELLERPRPEPALRQLCLGLDARAGPEHTRLKLYAIFEGDAAAHTRALCSALEVRPPDAAALALTHIVGVDLDRAGLRDVKLYYAMPPRKVTRTLSQPRLAIPILRGCRRVVYQRSLIVAGKASYHFHADAPGVVWDELARLRERAPATVELERRRRPFVAAGLAPWILAHPFAAGELERQTYSCYFHLSGPN